MDSGSGAIIVDSNDFSLVGSTAIIEVVFKSEDGTNSEALTLKVAFVAGPPQFDMEKFSVAALTCSPLDATWSMPLPPFLFPDIQTIKLKMLTVSSIFEFKKGSNFVVLDRDAR